MTAAHPRRVLVVAYFFPPVGGGGVPRTLAYVRNLPAAGWEPIVLTTRNAAYRVMDPGSMEQVPAELQVERTTIVEPAQVRRLARRARGAWQGPTGGSTAAPTTRGASSGAGPGPVHRALNTAWAGLVRFSFFPDEQALWAPFAVRRGREVHRRRALRALYSTSGPVTAHVIAGLMKSRTGLPWVADFRDPWIGNAFEAPAPWPHPTLRRRLERWIVDRADRVVFATPSLHAMYARRYPDHAWRFRTIPNGYESASEPDTAPPPAPTRPTPDGRFEIVFAGSLYGERELDIFLEGLSRFCERRPEPGRRLRVTFLGAMTEHNRAVAARWSAHLGDTVAYEGVVPRAEAQRRIAAANAALHLAAGGPGRELFVGGKLYEYLGLNRPVLAMVPPGDARTVLGELQWGVVVDPEPDAVAGGLERLVGGDFRTGGADPEGRYDRRHLTDVLADLLDEVAT